MSNFKVLDSKEESSLTPVELKKYYESLKSYIEEEVPQLYSKGGMRFRENYIRTVKKILPKLMPYEFIVDGLENIPEEPVIFASTHQDFYDAINSIYSCPEQMILYSAVNVKPFLKVFIILNGAIFVDRDDKSSRLKTKLELARVLLKGKSINVFPEATWNCSPNKLHLPLYKGIVDIAKITGAKIVPLVQEYTYDETVLDGKSHVINAHMRFGKPISVGVEDDSLEKLEEVSESIATIRWSLMEEKGVFNRSNITNELYTNYIKTRIRDWRIPGNDIDEERLQVRGAKEEFYLFHHINDVAFNENNELLPTEYVLKLNRINEKHLK